MMAAVEVFDWQLWWVCRRKRQYTFESQADSAAYSSGAPVPLVAYHCPFGEHWHVGRKANPLGATS